MQVRPDFCPSDSVDLNKLMVFFFVFLSFVFKAESGLSVLSLESGETHPAHPTSSDKVSVRDGQGGWVYGCVS